LKRVEIVWEEFLQVDVAPSFPSYFLQKHQYILYVLSLCLCLCPLPLPFASALCLCLSLSLSPLPLLAITHVPFQKELLSDARVEVGYKR
jgi:hypothetical protein